MKAGLLIWGRIGHELERVGEGLINCLPPNSGHSRLGSGRSKHPAHLQHGGAMSSGRELAKRKLTATGSSTTREPPSRAQRWLVYSIFAAGIMLLTCADGFPQSKPQDSLPVLTHVAQVGELSNEEAHRGYPVHLRAVVTYFSPADLFVQDSTAGIWVDLRGMQASFRPGQFLDLYGITAEGFAPYIGNPRWRVLGEAPLPLARRV